jgi:hypothetical protein
MDTNVNTITGYKLESWDVQSSPIPTLNFRSNLKNYANNIELLDDSNFNHYEYYPY